MMRAARATFPSAELEHLAAARPQGAHQPIVLGLAARAAGLTPLDAAYAAAYESIGGPATAAVRLLSLDPLDASGLLARLGPETDDVATPPPTPRPAPRPRASTPCRRPPHPCWTSPRSSTPPGPSGSSPPDHPPEHPFHNGVAMHLDHP